MNKLVCIGEALIDFIPNERGCALKEVDGFSKKPGGAPANVAVTVAKLGKKATFLGKVGADAFGDALVDTLNKYGVDTSHMLQSKEANTALAFVTLDDKGERDFSFYRNPSADMLYSEDEIDKNVFVHGDFLHFCSVSLIDAPVKQAHIRAIELAKEKDVLISFDPNVRLPLWDNPEACKKTVLEFMHHADVVKISDEELWFLTGIEDENKALKALKHYCKKDVVLLLTKGADGVMIVTMDEVGFVPSFEVEVVDTTGAGDAFIGGFLYFTIGKVLTKSGLPDMALLKEAVRYGSATGALTITKEGAMDALPYREQVEKMLENKVSL